MDKVGWDLEFTHPRGDVVKVEVVKGLSGYQPIVLLTANEWRAAQQHPDWWLAVVTSALADNYDICEYSGSQVLDVCEPHVFKWNMWEPKAEVDFDQPCC
jgi:Protein NO VEIN, C-terminal